MQPAPPQSFSASYDTTTRIFSAAFVLGFVIVAIVMHNAIFTGVATLLTLVAYGYSPRGYAVQVQDRSIIVNRLIGKARISLDTLREARPAAADELRGAIRLWGNGGLFGYYGLFRTPKLGKSRWYLTSRKNAVVVVTDKDTILFSPDDIQSFLAAIRVAIPVLQGLPAGPLDSLQSQRSRGRIGGVVAIAVALAVIGVLAFALTYSPGPPSYTLTGTSLTIHDRFYPVTVDAAAVAVGKVRVVDIAGNSEWRPVERTNGFANSHYHSGWFKVANGQKVRMYCGDGKRLVLLPPKGQGDTVLVAVTAPEAFVREVQHEWSKSS